MHEVCVYNGYRVLVCLRLRCVWFSLLYSLLWNGSQRGYLYFSARGHQGRLQFGQFRNGIAPVVEIGELDGDFIVLDGWKQLIHNVCHAAVPEIKQKTTTIIKLIKSIDIKFGPVPAPRCMQHKLVCNLTSNVCHILTTTSQS